MKILKSFGFGLILVSFLTGCMDGPFYAMKRVNPFFLSKWNKDRGHGPTFEDRIAELNLLESKLPSMSSEKQKEWAQRLESIVRNDPSPQMRSQAIAVIALVPSEAAERALNSASADEVEKVRLAACKAWQARGGIAARDMLLSLASRDESNSVRQAAIDGLAAFQEPEVLRSLNTLLDDNSPAVQQQVARTLTTLTGENYGGDLDAWKRYLDGIPDATQSNPPNSQGVLQARGFSALPPPQ